MEPNLDKMNTNPSSDEHTISMGKSLIFLLYSTELNISDLDANPLLDDLSMVPNSDVNILM